VIAVSSIWRWAVSSNDRALANARAAATECSRMRLERAEVDHYLAGLAALDLPMAGVTAKAASAAR
jgi:hypothetical protein